MAATIRIESAAFANALRQMRRQLKGDTQKYIRAQSGLFVAAVIKDAFPRDPGGKRQGERRVALDVAKAAAPLTDKPMTVNGVKFDPTFDDIKDERLKAKLNQLVRAKNHAGIEAILRNFKKGRRSTGTVRAFTPALHKEARGPRGRTKPTGVMTPDVQAWKRYVRERSKNVGLWKHGWTAAAKRLIASGIPVRVPAWVMKARRFGNGAISISGETLDKYLVTMRNPYGYHRSAADQTRRVLEQRGRTMARDIARIVKGGANRWGLTAR